MTDSVTLERLQRYIDARITELKNVSDGKEKGQWMPSRETYEGLRDDVNPPR